MEEEVGMLTFKLVVEGRAVDREIWRALRLEKMLLEHGLPDGGVAHENL